MKSIQISLLFLILFSGCGLKTKTLEEFYNDDLYEVSKITIVDGNTGESVTNTDREQIRLLIDNILDIKFIPEEDQSKRDGFNYSIIFYRDGEETFQFGMTEINGNYYQTNPDMMPIIDEFYSITKKEED